MHKLSLSSSLLPKNPVLYLQSIRNAERGKYFFGILPVFSYELIERQLFNRYHQSNSIFQKCSKRGSILCIIMYLARKYFFYYHSIV
mgnify:FL=1